MTLVRRNNIAGKVITTVRAMYSSRTNAVSYHALFMSRASHEPELTTKLFIQLRNVGGKLCELSRKQACVRFMPARMCHAHFQLIECSKQSRPLHPICSKALLAWLCQCRTRVFRYPDANC